MLLTVNVAWAAKTLTGILAAMTIYATHTIMETMTNRRKSLLQRVRWVLPIALTLIILAVLVADYALSKPKDAVATFVGSDRCVSCHQLEHKLWTGSDHDRAMEPATADTVLADFDNVRLEHLGTTATMSQRDGQYWVRTEGPDGNTQDFRIEYTFGCQPLQQYMAEIEPASTEDGLGRVQVLRWSWDTEKEVWFYLEPPDVDERLEVSDPLHWTGYAQNWNHMCAECHSTNLVKGFSVDENRYGTTYSEIDVSCEACHGPGSLHADIAESRWLFWDRNHRYGLATDFKSASNVDQIQACARCHARRTRVSDQFQHGTSFDDHYATQLLTPDTYYPDGQILDEVYVFGSFIQSKMFAKDVKCTDCHHPHSGKVKFSDNRLCTSCHQHSAAKYDTPAHHHHTVGSSGASCIECHMPATPYMDVDLRRDHQLKSPRPDQSVRFQTPNSCTGCHLSDSDLAKTRTDLEHYADWLAAAREGDAPVRAELARLDQWAAEWVRKWYGDPPRDSCVVEGLHAGWNGHDDANAKLIAILKDDKQAAIYRASAVVAMLGTSTPETDAVVTPLISDKSPLVRAAAATYFGQHDRATRLQQLKPLLQDPVRMVRSEAARILAPDSNFIRSSDFDRAMDEYRSALAIDSDQSATHLSLALVAEAVGNIHLAVRHYHDAIRVQPNVTGPRSNLAALYERQGQPEKALEMRAAELPLIERDARLVPDNAQVQYRLGLSYYLLGRTSECEAPLLRARQIDPSDMNTLLFLALYYQKQESWDKGLEVARALVETAPDNQMFQRVYQAIEQRQRAN